MTLSSGPNNMPSLADPGFILQRRRKVVLVVDLVESVSLMQADELRVITRWQAFLAHVNQLVLPANEGRLVKSMGDGLMVEFESAPNAVAAAMAMHAWMNAGLHDIAPFMQLRAGLHSAEIYADQHDIYGAGVNLAARIATLAGPGETVVSAEIRDRLTDGLDGPLEDLGECYLKHLEAPVRAWRVGPAGRNPVVAAKRDYAAPLRPTIAVIPFTARSREAEHFAVGELIADGVIAQLSRVSEFKLISRLSSAAFRDRGATVDNVALSLGADYVVSGSYVMLGTKLQVSPELSGSRDHVLLWTDRIHGDVADLLAAQSELANAISSNVQAAISQKEVAQALTRPLPTLASCSLMFGAMSLTYSMARAEFFRAQELLLHLMERHRRHPLLPAWLAKWHVLQVEQGWADDPVAVAHRALDHSSHALDLDPHSSLALTIDGFVRCNLHQDFDAAADRYRAALQCNASEPLAWLFLGMLHAFRGEAAPALDAAERAQALSPLDPAKYFYDSLAASVQLSAGNYERSIELARRSLRANGSHLSTHRALTIAQVMAGHMDEARTSAARLMRLDPQLTVSRYLARSPGVRVGPGRRFAEALRAAGVPQ